jgi:hypothetical protein
LPGTLVEKTRESFEKRLQELREEIGPKQSEMTEIERVLAAMRGSRSHTSRSGNPRGRKPQREQEFLRVVEQNPGIIVSDAAREMGIKQNYLYRVAAKALDGGLVHKDDDGGYHLIAEPAPANPGTPESGDE